MLYFLKVHAVIFISYQDAYCVFTALFVDLIVKARKLLVQTLRTTLEDAGSIEDVDRTFRFTKESRREGSLLLCLCPESELGLSLFLTWESHFLRVVVDLLGNGVACFRELRTVRYVSLYKDFLTRVGPSVHKDINARCFLSVTSSLAIF